MTLLHVYDSEKPQAVPMIAEFILGYTDGVVTHDNYRQMKGNHPNAHVIPVTVTGRDLDAAICDCEKGDATPAEAVQWAVEKHNRAQAASDKIPAVYFARASYHDVMKEVTDKHAAAFIRTIVADYNNHPDIPNDIYNCIGHQYANAAITGHDYDLSVMESLWVYHALGLSHPNPLTPNHRLMLRQTKEFMDNRYAHKWVLSPEDKNLVTAVVRSLNANLALK